MYIIKIFIQNFIVYFAKRLIIFVLSFYFFEPFFCYAASLQNKKYFILLRHIRDSNDYSTKLSDSVRQKTSV